MKKEKTFNERCYELLRKVPLGRVTTYGEIARALGTRAYRAVGNAMNKNPYPSKEVACHRVVKSDGSLGGYDGGEDVKIEMLEHEGVFVRDGKVVDFNKILFKFNG